MQKPDSFVKTAILIAFLWFITSPLSTVAQIVITAVQPADKATLVNTGILKWSAPSGYVFDLYLGTSPNPPLYKPALSEMELKPVILALNSTYYWKIVGKKAGLDSICSKVFSFSTLPIQLNKKVPYSSCVDERDYKIYWTVNIGGKEWFAQNLDYELPEYSWYYQNNGNQKVFGKLYLGAVLKDHMNSICPQGWHIPAQTEWRALLDASGGIKTAGKDLKESSSQYWQTSKNQGTNESGMTVLPAGSRDSKPEYSNLKKYTNFWSSTPNPQKPGMFTKYNLGFMRDQVIEEAGDPDWGYSIRCIRD